jgi:hypothetical protein
MDRSGLFWIGLIVVVLVFLDLLFVELRRVFREGKRIVTRLAAYADLPLFAELAASEYYVGRIVRALDTFARLIERAQTALAVLRRYIPKGSSPG